MEDDEYILPVQNEQGVLDVSNRSWARIEHVCKVPVATNDNISAFSMRSIIFDTYCVNIDYYTIFQFSYKINEHYTIHNYRGRTLVELNLSYNRISEVPSQIGTLEMLKILNISFNKISELPPSIGKLKRLRELHASSNSLTGLPTEMSQLALLEVNCSAYND